MNARSPGRAPPGARPSASRRRTASASKPSPAEKQKRRPFTDPERDPAQSRLGDRRARSARSFDRIAGHAERARQDARPAARQEPERHLAVGAVQRLVVRAVAGEHEDRVDIRRCSLGRELGGVAGTLRELGPQVDPLAQRVLDLGDPASR